jgi:hypothetical protein
MRLVLWLREPFDGHVVVGGDFETQIEDVSGRKILVVERDCDFLMIPEDLVRIGSVVKTDCSFEQIEPGIFMLGKTPQYTPPVEPPV